METKTITPEMKEQFRTIFLDARESSISHHKKAIEFSNDMDNVRSDIVGYRDALSTTYEIAIRLSDFSSFITSALGEWLMLSKKRGTLTEGKADRCFEFLKLLIDIAYSKEDIAILCAHYYKKVNLIESVDIDELDEYINTVFKD